MANTLRAKIHQMLPVEHRESNGKTYRSQQIIFNATRFDENTGHEYPNYPSINFNDRGVDTIMQLGLAEGDLVEVSFTLKGRFYTKNGEEKNFTVAEGYKIERMEQRQRQYGPYTPQSAPVQPEQYAPATAVDEPGDACDDLPF